jgi:parallel beta-helix repeat protein
MVGKTREARGLVVVGGCAVLMLAPACGGGGPTVGSSRLAETSAPAGSDASAPKDAGAARAATSEACPAGSVTVAPTDDVEDLVRTKPAGTTFCLTAGLFRLTQPLVPKTGDAFTGPACTPTVSACTAVVSGGIDIGTLARANGSDWEVTGQTQHGTVNSYSCDPGWSGCNYPEDLFYDGAPLQHVDSASRPTLSSGQWWFDYTNHVIYFHDAPSGHKVETSVVSTMFHSDANDVTVKNLTIEEFASPTIAGAVDPGYGYYPVSSTTSINWTIQSCYITLNHGEGVRTAFGERALDNVLHLNGQFGIGGGVPAGSGITSSRLLVQGNTVTNNNYAHVDPGFGAGGMKFGNTADAVVRNNVVKNNLGNGIHFDVDSIRPLIDGNTVIGNGDSAASSTGDGIRFEIGNVGATFRNNVVQRNGVGGTGPSYQLVSADSAGAVMYCNVVEIGDTPHEQGIIVGASNRGDNTVEPFEGQQIVSINNSVHHNTVIWDLGSTGMVGWLQNDAANQPKFFADNVPPDFNQYHAPSVSSTNFTYDDNDTAANARKTFAEFQSAGADKNGTIDTVYDSGFPTVTITSPADQSSFGTSVEIVAAASDASGISKMEFYVDWTLEATVTHAPYEFDWKGAATGSHTVAAMGYSKAGIRACRAVTLTKL